MSTLSNAQDAWGLEFENCAPSKGSSEIIERDDGYVDVDSPEIYFGAYPDWPPH